MMGHPAGYSSSGTRLAIPPRTGCGGIQDSRSVLAQSAESWCSSLLLLDRDRRNKYTVSSCQGDKAQHAK